MAAPPLFRPGMALPLLWESRHFAIIDKPAGLAAHPGPGGHDNVEERLMPRKRGGPWLAHRLDADTAGCLLIARRKTALIAAQKAFAERRVAKRYWALVAGRPAEQEGTLTTLLQRVSNPQAGWKMISSPMPCPGGTAMAAQEAAPRTRRQSGRVGPGRTASRKTKASPPGQADAGREARTSWRVLASDGTTSLLELTLHTGRTHQARIHCAALGTPILGDPLYGMGSAHRPALHGAALPDGLCLLARSLDLSILMEDPARPAEAPRPVSIQATADAPYMEAFLKAHPHHPAQDKPQSTK